VIDAVRLATHIHRDATPTGYQSVVTMRSDQRLVAQSLPALGVTLADLDLR
jgi:hypothetical protein